VEKDQKKAEATKQKQTATVIDMLEGLKATSDQKKQHNMVNCTSTNLKKAGRDGEDMAHKVWVSEGESVGGEYSCIPAGEWLEYTHAGDDGEVAGMVGGMVEIVPRLWKRAGHVMYGWYTAHWLQQIPSNRRSLDILCYQYLAACIYILSEWTHQLKRYHDLGRAAWKGTCVQLLCTVSVSLHL